MKSMFQGIVGKLPAATKTKMALRAIGLTTPEVNELDKLVGTLKGNEFIGPFVPDNISSFTSLIEKGVSFAANPGNAQVNMPANISAFIHNSNVTNAASKVLATYVDKNSGQFAVNTLMSAAGKVIDMASEEVPRDFDSLEKLFANGFFPAIRELLPEQTESPVATTEAVIECKRCGHVDTYDLRQ